MNHASGSLALGFVAFLSLASACASSQPAGPLEPAPGPAPAQVAATPDCEQEYGSDSGDARDTAVELVDLKVDGCVYQEDIADGYLIRSPGADKVRLRFQALSDRNYVVRMFDANGKKLDQKIITNGEGFTYELPVDRKHPAFVQVDGGRMGRTSPGRYRLEAEPML